MIAFIDMHLDIYDGHWAFPLDRVTLRSAGRFIKAMRLAGPVAARDTRRVQASEPRPRARA